MQAAVQRLDPVGETAETGAAGGVGAADAVVRDLDHGAAVQLGDADGDRRGRCVLGDVRQRLRDDVVRRGLYWLRKPVLREIEVDRKGSAGGKSLERGAEPSIREHRGMDAAGELPQLCQRVGQLLGSPFEQALGLGRIRLQAGLRQPKPQGE